MDSKQFEAPTQMLQSYITIEQGDDGGLELHVDAIDEPFQVKMHNYGKIVIKYFAPFFQIFRVFGLMRILKFQVSVQNFIHVLQAILYHGVCNH